MSRAEIALLVGLTGTGDEAERLDDHFDELERLVETAGGRVAARFSQHRRGPDPATWIGRGKAKELAEAVKSNAAGLVIVEGELSPVQMRNLSELTEVRVLDRNDLILDIFARHARTREARLAVELALLQQQLPRLAGQWYGLSRQGGGIGTRGVGETRLELDRRVVRDRIARLKRELEKVEVSRRVQRRGRDGSPLVALAGYTNAGKSSLYNRLSSDSAYAADRLFATLDSRHARLPLPAMPDAILVDTVGFIRRLPPRLVASFRSTLAEIAEADLVLHVVDASHPAAAEQIDVVQATLIEIGVEVERIQIVLNKVDRQVGAAVGISTDGSVRVSALTGEGLEALRQRIADRLTANWTVTELDLPAADGRTMALIRDRGTLLEMESVGDRLKVRARLPAAMVEQLARRRPVP